MINFDNIDQYSIKYDFYNRYLRFTHNHFYYKHYTIQGRENIPPKGKPIMVISNHQNGLMDALAILYLFNDYRQPVFIARGDIFKKETVAKILRFLKILPTFRTRDGDRSDIKSNNKTFDLAAKILNRGGTVAMFPEAAHQSGHFLSTFKKGFPRIAFAAEEAANFELDLEILPLAIHYSNYFSARNELLVTVGEPFKFSELFELYQNEPNNAYLALNEKARAAVKEIALDIDIPEYYQELELLRTVYCKPHLRAKGISSSNIVNQFAEDKETIAHLREMKTSDEAKFTHLMNITKTYREGLNKLNLRDWLINRPVKLGHLLLYSLGMILLFPFFLFGLINNILPFEFSAIFRKKIKDRMLHSSFNYVSSCIISFPLMYIIILIVASCVFHSFWIGLCYLLSAFISFFIFYFYKKQWIKFKATWRYYRLKRKKDATLIQLEQIKNEILAE